MPDTSGHDQPQRDERHTVPLRELEARLIEDGVLMSRRQLTRHCEGGTFDAKKLPAANNVLEWFIAPASIDKGIADIKTLQELRARRDASRPDMTSHVVVNAGRADRQDASGHVAARPDMSPAAIQQPGTDIAVIVSPGPDASGHDAHQIVSLHATDVASHDRTRPAVTNGLEAAEKGKTQPRSGTSMDIFAHPYVQRLEDRIDRLEAKYEAQVRRTEEIQIKSHERLVELQRMTAVGQSRTLADFMLKAKDWMLREGQEEKGREDQQPEA